MTNPLALQTPPHAISAQFASRPTVETAAWQLISGAIRERYPTIDLDQSSTRVAIPIEGGKWQPESLMDYVMGFLGDATEPDFQGRLGQPTFLMTHNLIIKTSPPGVPSTYPDMALIKQMIIELPWGLVAALQNNLAAYWNETADTGVSRWKWLSDRLMDTLRTCALEQSDLDELERETLDQLVRYPELAQRTALFGERAVHAYCPEVVFSHGTVITRQLSPMLLLVRSVNGQTRVLLCDPSGTCERFTTLDAFTQTWGQRMAAEYEVAQVTINRYEPDGNIFDSHAATLLNQQLENLQTLEMPARQGIDQLERLYRTITEPGRYFLNPSRTAPPVLGTLRAQLPDWLQQASASDRIAYRHYSLALASAKRRSQGATFLSGIADIRTFASAELLKQLLLDEVRLGKVEAGRSTAGPFQPEDLQLEFTKAVGYPNTVGITERTTMSLTDAAIKNLVGLPGKLSEIKHSHGLTLPTWLTPEYIAQSGGLIEQVDIGGTYPLILEAQLLGDGPGIAAREASFADQTAAQLPLLALELKLKKQNGLTEKGVRYVCALLRSSLPERCVDGRAVVIRQLALLRKPEAVADFVANMFIIEAHDIGAQDIEAGPHILYRPLYPEPLLEFATRPLLLQALAEPGELQTSVLTWLPENTKAIYDNGGFKEPHYTRFGVGSDFAPIEQPVPAALAIGDRNSELQAFLANGSLMKYLYGSNARALVDQAGSDSISTKESRWAVFMKGASAIFSTLLLPLLRGPAMLAGWLIALSNSARHDIPALNSPDPVTRELAWVDLLLNVGTLLLMPPSATVQPPELLGANIPAKSLKLPAPRRDPGQWPRPKPTEIREGIVALDPDAVTAPTSPLDFSSLRTRTPLTPSQRTRLEALRTQKPEGLPAPVASGPLQGLYDMHGNWYAQVEGHWYRVETREDDTVVITFPSDSGVRGPMLKSDGAGQWSLDLGLRLRGGMPLNRIAAARKLKADRKLHLTEEFNQLLSDQETLQAQVDRKYLAMNRSNSTSTRRAFDEALQSQTDRYIQLLDTLKERRDLQIPVPLASVTIFLSNTIKNARKSSLMAYADRVELIEQNQAFFGDQEAVALQILSQKDRYTQFTRQLIAINQRQIRALECQDRYLRELAELGSPAAGEYQTLTADRGDEITLLGVKYLQIQSLKFSIFKNLADFPDELSNILYPLASQVRTHAELDRLELPPKERLQVLESLNEHYGQTADALRGQAILHADALEMEYFNQIQQLIEGLYLDTTRRLATQIKPDAQVPAPQAKRPMAVPGKPQKKVINTRKQGSLIGELKPANNDLAIEHVEIRSEQDNKLLSTYTLHDGTWDEVRVVAPTRPPVTRQLNIIKNSARQRLADLNQILAREERYAHSSHFPVEIEESLQHEAGRYRDLASELERALARGEQTDEELLGELKKAAETLTRKGQELRISASLALPPTHANLNYLLEQRKVHVVKLGGRKAMRNARNDFIQEYVINNERNAPVWYAHFHYPNANTPKQSYSVAHLKTIQQRTESYHSLLAKSSGDQEVVSIHRGIIGKTLAEHWFLTLAS
ncbi:dermonecrotic toxin domain-containing protein [Pseudomonas poae]|uniref:Dermonecrotic toxin N-terminal domain-containing protein n=2 Tax=Pseudomonas poae TaxID=200451 RepID=A0A2S9EI49_9PSED|nr:DUF6543 domain-containing protein [Pseudomonas poae]PRC14908.1 hypothetical protein CQZ99_18760 [Pseudomonas poae]